MDALSSKTASTSIVNQLIDGGAVTPQKNEESLPESKRESAFLRFAHKANGIDALVMCGKKPKRAVISFTSMNPGKYERWSWFHNKHREGCEDLYIIFRDNDHRYYIGSDTAPTQVRYHKFISEHLQKHNISSKDTFLIGSSMGGYAALYFGFWMDVGGIIVTNPQVDYQSSRRHSLQNWERQIREAGTNWVDLNDFIYRFPSKPKLYIEHGDYPADAAAAQKLFATLDDLKLTYTRSYVGGDHSSTNMDASLLFKIIDFWGK
ncbi:YqiA/YcfP family alpha/beta fold hydrolase [Pseudomonas sp. IT-P291]|uniref:YqiA/YcfP family alpha/beta fold hydrolase n=1 Tax=Pseudomonas sp. IT-P291 TaxID=3026448 RepID=UPI0039E07673